VRQISIKLEGGDFALFLDNLSVHKTKDAKVMFEELNITKIFNVPYCPQINRMRANSLKLRELIRRSSWDQ
jgi:hypothetical protein